MEDEIKPKRGAVDGVFHVEYKKENGKTTGYIHLNATPVVISITDGTDTVQLGHFGGGAIFVPGSLHQFAQMLDIWANSQLFIDYPEVHSEVYSGMGLLSQLQGCSNKYIDESRWGSFYGKSLNDVRKELWDRFAKENLDRYLTGQTKRNLKKSFMDALNSSLKRFRIEQIRKM